MNPQQLLIIKCRLRAMLLRKEPQELTDAEIAQLKALASDEDIQEAIKKSLEEQGKANKPELKITGVDSKVAILRKARRAAIKAGWTGEQIDGFVHKAQSGDYGRLLQMCEAYFNVV